MAVIVRQQRHYVFQFANCFSPHDNLPRVAKSIRPQQNRIHHAEDCSDGTSPKRQRKNRRQRKSRRLPQPPQCIAKILHTNLHPGQSPLHAILLPCLRHSTKFTQCCRARLIRRHPAPQMLRNRKLHMRVQLLIQASIQLLAPK